MRPTDHWGRATLREAPGTAGGASWSGRQPRHVLSELTPPPRHASLLSPPMPELPFLSSAPSHDCRQQACRSSQEAQSYIRGTRPSDTQGTPQTRSAILKQPARPPGRRDYVVRRKSAVLPGRPDPLEGTKPAPRLWLPRFAGARGTCRVSPAVGSHHRLPWSSVS